MRALPGSRLTILTLPEGRARARIEEIFERVTEEECPRLERHRRGQRQIEPEARRHGLGEERRGGDALVATSDRDAFQLCSRIEGIIPALEPAHALAQVRKLAPQMKRDQIIVMNMCGRGDKDVFTVAKALGVEL